MESSIQVGVNGPVVWVRVEGRGSFLNSGSFKQFSREMVERGFREFVVDLQDCIMMDSTFMGTMAGLALRLKEIQQGHLHVVHCGQRSKELLSGLGLDQLFDISTNGAAAPTCEALAQASAGVPEGKRVEQSREILEAHQALCDAAPQNLLRFKDVLDYLKHDLHQAAATK